MKKVLFLMTMLVLWLTAQRAGAWNVTLAGTNITDANKDDLTVIDGVVC